MITSLRGIIKRGVSELVGSGVMTGEGLRRRRENDLSPGFQHCSVSRLIGFNSLCHLIT